jgi:hypothetical protein
VDGDRCLRRCFIAALTKSTQNYIRPSLSPRGASPQGPVILSWIPRTSPRYDGNTSKSATELYTKARPQTPITDNRPPTTKTPITDNRPLTTKTPITDHHPSASVTQMYSTASVTQRHYPYANSATQANDLALKYGLSAFQFADHEYSYNDFVFA